MKVTEKLNSSLMSDTDNKRGMSKGHTENIHNLKSSGGWGV